MLLGIKLSNLSRDPKNLKAQKIFLTNFAESQTSALSKVSSLPSACWRHSATCLLCRVPEGGTRQRLNAVSPPDGRRTAGARARHVHELCRLLLGQHSAKETLCRVPCFADGRHSVKPGHAVCQFFAECPVWHSAKSETLGKLGFSGSAAPTTVLYHLPSSGSVLTR